MTGDYGGWVDETVPDPGDDRPRSLGRRVFISYSTRDGAEAADFLVNAIEAKGVACWIAPRDLGQGTRWARYVDRALGEAAGLVVIVSPGSNTSDWCYREVDGALRRRIPIWWVGLSQTAPADNLGFYLNVIHGVPLENLDIHDLVLGFESRGNGPLQRLGLTSAVVDSDMASMICGEAEVARRDGQYDLADRRYADLLVGMNDAEQGSDCWKVSVVGRAFTAFQSGATDRVAAEPLDTTCLALSATATAADRARHAARVRLLEQRHQPAPAERAGRGAD